METGTGEMGEGEGSKEDSAIEEGAEGEGAEGSGDAKTESGELGEAGGGAGGGPGSSSSLTFLENGMSLDLAAGILVSPNAGLTPQGTSGQANRPANLPVL